MVKQVGLLSAGCQPWNHDVCDSSHDRFAYCATLAIYVYQLDRQFNEFKLVSIMSEHKKTITAFSWNPRNPDIFVSSSADHKLIVWNISEQKVVSLLSNTKEAPCSVGWCPYDTDIISFISSRGPMYSWNYKLDNGVTVVKEAQSFNSDVCQLRWHPKSLGKVVFGHVDGSISVCNIGSKSRKHVFRPDDLEDSEEVDPVTSLEWDPLSAEYLLMANLHYGVRLVDTQSLVVIMMFQLPSAAAHIQTLSWVSGAPGMFLTGDSHHGTLRIWNVSKSTPIENVRLKKTGFHALQVVYNPSTETKEENSSSREKFISSTSQAMAPSKTTQSNFALPPARLVCTFKDGGVGLYDLGRRRWNFLRDQGHMETIFDCKFKPDDPDMLATASFDGTIKVWDINTMKAVFSSIGNEGVIYHISWAPGNLDCIAACTSKNGVFIWNIRKGKVIKRFNEHGKNSVYSVSWSQKDSKRIMSCGADGYCIVRQVDGQVVQKYRHPGAVFGGDWSPNNKDILATGCEDKCVRVYYLATSSDQPLRVFTGHTAKVFHVRWSPLREGILCSGSDDGTIRVWDYTQEQCISVLCGHTDPIRGLLWNTEVPYMLISGSWDYSIRIWDTRDGACIDTVLDHGADVYGLTCHPERPFLLASCSRDSTVRLWSLTSLIQPIEIHILAGKPISDVVGVSDSAMSLGTSPMLSGRESKELRQRLENMPGNAIANQIKFFSKFFAQPTGTNNLWELVSVVMGATNTLLSPEYKTGIMHSKHLTMYKASDAQELEMVKMSRHGSGIGAPSKEESLREAAAVHIKLGNIQRYCELMVEVGEWHKALIAAPGVSMAYWKSLAGRYAQSLMSEEKDDAIPLLVATSNSEALVDYLSSQGQMIDALLTAQAACEGFYPQHVGTSSAPSSAVNGCDSPSEDQLSLVRHATTQLAKWYYNNGLPILAACCHMAVDDCQSAMSKLIQGNELELAVGVGTVLHSTPQHLSVATELLSRRCEALGKWDLGVELLKTLPDSDLLLAKLCARCAASMDEINLLHKAAGFPTMDGCLREAEKLKTKIDFFNCVKYYLMSTTPEAGLDVGLGHIRSCMRKADWTASDVFDLLQLLGCMKTEKLQQQKCEKKRLELLVYSAYIGGLVAIRRKYTPIVSALFSHAIDLMSKERLDLPFTEADLTSALQTWKDAQCGTGQTDLRDVNAQGAYELLMRRVGSEMYVIESGPDCVASSQLPSHSDVHISCLTGQRVQGLAFFLEDGQSALSVNEALMWAKVNPFSPLGSGMRINPF
ncbi:WD repeat-containing protein 17-like [Haliotis asinina]|uniref:WD repeat-containing protein 17-like n=1 Tax=Haliotis asinina TaxID=109174 RepID=UPI0035323857